MGCILTKHSTQSGRRRGLEKLKLENGYARRAVGRKQQGKNPSGNLVPQGQGAGNKKGGVGLGGGGGGEERKVRIREEENRDLGGDVLEKILQKKKIAGDELVDGWPRWLADNIPREVLLGLVPKSVDSYEKLEKVGQGTYSNVYKARDRATGEIVALKKVRFDASEAESVKFMAREIMIQRKLDHPNVMKLEGLATSRMQYSLYLVFDFMHSDLAKIISHPDRRLSEPQVKCYMQQLLSGLQHCHERGILHRDIKGSNLLIDKGGMLKIADFGLANYFNPKPRRPLTSRVVTLWYRPPELLLGATDYGVGVDLWSAGCLLAEMFVGKPIMPGRTEVEQLHKIFKLCGSPSEDYWKKMKLPASFRPPQQYKPSLQETFGEFPPSSFGLLTQLLALDPTYRGCAASALQSEFFSSSPLACDLSGLPVVYKWEDKPTQTNGRKKHRSSKTRQRPQTNRRGCGRDELIVMQDKEDAESSKQEIRNAEAKMDSQEIATTAMRISFSLHASRHEESIVFSPIPAVKSHQNRSPRTEGHPNASKNIQNLPHSRASTTDSSDRSEGNKSTLHRRSISTMDFRILDAEQVSKLFSSGND
ncbi:probable serine/threonine-protein kinase At1g54610 [Malania oleifera]|uniref:probable serine/threonine-protein kinase At1g54610 n=1 Tax=Malania oleifera TaxID=397392 RepID=UPI0025ADCA1F|nr:probable serine/threonine-protein kinase At1g54610 [Malania oleifera]